MKNQFNEKALNNKNTVNLAIYKNNKIHCHDLKDLDDCIGDYKKNSDSKILVIWLGNSQLHAINQYKSGEKTSTFNLHKYLEKDNFYLITLSQPNANLQEHLLLFGHLLSKKLPIKHLILPLVFDDMRENEIRIELKDAFNSTETIEILKKFSFGKKLIKQYKITNDSVNKFGKIKQTPQEISEYFLNKNLENNWKLWSHRHDLRSYTIERLYYLRNTIFNINP